MLKAPDSRSGSTTHFGVLGNGLLFLCLPSIANGQFLENMKMHNSLNRILQKSYNISVSVYPGNTFILQTV